MQNGAHRAISQPAKYLVLIARFSSPEEEVRSDRMVQKYLLWDIWNATPVPSGTPIIGQVPEWSQNSATEALAVEVLTTICPSVVK